MDRRPFRVVRWLRRSERGQAIIEFAIGAPLLLVMLIGLVEFGHALNSYLTVIATARDAARMGARIGIEAESVDKMEAAIAKEVERLDNPDGVTVDITSCAAPLNDGPACDDPEGQPVDRWLKVEVCYDHPTITNALLVPNSIHMCSATTIRIAKTQE